MAETVTVDAPFDTARGALIFAFNHSDQQYERPMMNRVAAPAMGNGKGLGGVDGAGQAGIIRSKVRELGALAEAIIIARIAPRTVPCECRASCCRGYEPNKEWLNAIGWIADHVRTTALAGCVAHGLMRRAYVTRYFTGKDSRMSLEEIAEEFRVDRRTITAHCLKVTQYLGGMKGGSGKPDSPGFETLAMNAIEDALIKHGIVKKSDSA